MFFPSFSSFVNNKFKHRGDVITTYSLLINGPRFKFFLLI